MYQGLALGLGLGFALGFGLGIGGYGHGPKHARPHFDRREGPLRLLRPLPHAAQRPLGHLTRGRGSVTGWGRVRVRVRDRVSGSFWPPRRSGDRPRLQMRPRSLEIRRRSPAAPASPRARGTTASGRAACRPPWRTVARRCAASISRREMAPSSRRARDLARRARSSWRDRAARDRRRWRCQRRRASRPAGAPHPGQG